MEKDSFLTINTIAQGSYTEKRSRFVAFAIPVQSIDEIKDLLEQYRKQYYDARHICWAYVLGAEGLDFRVNDDGEPSSTAGRPILGQIYSKGLTDILVLVIRYFGGIKLGTSGLIMAYRSAAAEVLNSVEIVERTIDDELSIRFEYPYLNSVMRVIKEENPHIVYQKFDMNCEITLRIRRSRMAFLRTRLLNISTVMSSIR